MIDNGLNTRLEILERDFKSKIVPQLQAHKWQYNVEKIAEGDGRLHVTITRNSYQKTFAILYSQSTRKEIYKQIENTMDACLINGLSYDLNNSFSFGFKKAIDSTYSFMNILKDWNNECPLEEQEDSSNLDKPINIPEKLFLQAENSIEQIWMFIKSLRSKDVNEKFIQNKFKNGNCSNIEAKAEGVAFLIQNACDYFEDVSSKNITQKMLNLYYGVLSFMEADILMNSNEYSDLKSVESITKYGHGLFTFISDTDTIENLYTGILNNGLFAKWLELYGYDTKRFNSQRIKDEKDINDYCYRFNDILNRIPELSPLMLMIDSQYLAGCFNIYYSQELNDMSFSNKQGYQPTNKGYYFELKDYSCRSDLSMIKTLMIDNNIEQVRTEGIITDKNGEQYKKYSFFLKYENSEMKNDWWKSLNVHSSNYCSSSILLPLKGLKSDWLVYSIMILYTFSIIVRYFPNVWRRIQYGESDKYYTLCLQFAMIVENIMPKIFYQKITNQNLYISKSIF